MTAYEMRDGDGVTPRRNGGRGCTGGGWERRVEVPAGDDCLMKR